MFKKLALAAALATAFTGAAQAQSTVTIYGRLNVTAERQKLNDVTTTDLVNNASRIGFKGSEDIGNGLKANFVLESGFDATNGTADAPFFAREATVGLSGQFGAVRLGNMPASEAYFAIADYVSMHNHDTGTSSDAFYALGYRIATTRLSNTVAYTSPTTNGLRFDAQVGANDGEGDRRIALAANYDAGPIHAGAGYENFNGLKSLAIRGLYEMGDFTFGGYIEKDSGHSEVVLSPAYAGQVALDASRTALRLSVMYKVGAGELHGNVGSAGKIGDLADSDAKQFTLGYNYNLSTRTKVYAFYTKLDDGAARFYGGEFDSIAVGLRHNF